jgi:rhodanese-related sulfurtransferase
VALTDEAKKKIRQCSIADVAARRDRNEDFLLVDVREDSEFAKDHIPSAMHIGRGVLERDIEAKVPSKDREIVLYCGGGFRSALAAESLQRMGYTHVVSMDGGITAWREAGWPLSDQSIG